MITWESVLIFIMLKPGDSMPTSKVHDDVIKWKHFPRDWPFVRGIPGEFPAKRPVKRSFDVFFNLRLHGRLSKQSLGWWFETLSRPLWSHRNGMAADALATAASIIDIYPLLPLQWRHNGYDSVSNHQPYDCLLNGLFRRRSKKTWKLRVTGLCVGNSLWTGEFLA